MPIINRSVTSTLLLTQAPTVTNGSTIPCYGTIEAADYYFEATLEGQRWMNSPRRKKQQALVSATRRIERLNFKGSQAVAGQTLQFPRGTDTLVPVEIQQACYELAQALLKGVEADTEADLAVTTLQAYGGLRTEYDRASTQPWMLSGIPCFAAWTLLLPFIDERREMVLTKVN